jgi:predicted transcriptional regulator
MRDCNPAVVSAEEVISGDVYSVAPEDEIRKALELMQQHQIRRLPVINPEGGLEGMLSMNDIVLKAKEKQNAKIGFADVVKTYQAICAHRPPEPEPAQAAAASQ